MWKKFNYDEFKKGLFWFRQESPVLNADGTPTGEKKVTFVLAWVDAEINGEPMEPLFTPVDPDNHGKLENEGVITHFAKVVPGSGVKKKSKEPLLFIGWGVAGLVFLLGHLLIRFFNLGDTTSSSVTFYCSLLFVAFISGAYAMFKCSGDCKEL